MDETDSIPVPDPSSRTIKLVTTALGAERKLTDARLEIIVTRIDGIDEASRVLHEAVTRVPTDVQQAVGHLKELTDRHFLSNDVAISKTERVTDASIEKLGQLFRSQLDSMRREFDIFKSDITEVKLQLQTIQSVKAGQGQVASWLIAAVGLIGTIVAIAIALGIGVTR